MTGAPARSRQVALVVAGLLLGGLAFGLHAGSWVGHNGDHFYYTSTALEFSGVPYDQAIHTSTRHFDYPLPTGELDRGSLNPSVAPLMYPRDLLPLVAVPAVRLVGVAGVWGPGLAFGTLTLLCLVGLTWRRAGAVAAAAVPLFLLGPLTGSEYAFGIFTEAPLILLTTLLLALLPLGARRGWGHAVAAAALVPLMLLSRQVPVLAVAMVLGGWLWAAIGTRRVRNAWWPFVVTVVPTTLVADLVMARWAPFDPLLVLRVFTKQHSLVGMLRGAEPFFVRATKADVRYLLGHDRLGVALVLLALAGLVVVIRHPLAGVFTGALASGLTSAYLSPSAVHFRYESPMLPVVVVLAAIAVARLVALVRRMPWETPPLAGAPLATAVEAPAGDRAAGEEQAPQPTDGPRRRARVGGWATAAAAWSVVVLVVGAVVALHQPAPAVAGQQVQVSRADYGAAWPFTVASGTLSCAGSDYEVWFRSDTGTTYALSGTAMMRSFLVPRAESIRAQRTPAWPEAVPLLSRGMQLCGRAYQAHS